MESMAIVNDDYMIQLPYQFVKKYSISPGTVIDIESIQNTNNNFHLSFMNTLEEIVRKIYENNIDKGKEKIEESLEEYLDSEYLSDTYHACKIDWYKNILVLTYIDRFGIIGTVIYGGDKDEI
ncbi:MAG: hypothetical protein [Caudoviricetes sp.]|nr:MAG: hypothetical protein [Caudoviricetes sp.]